MIPELTRKKFLAIAKRTGQILLALGPLSAIAGYLHSGTDNLQTKPAIRNKDANHHPIDERLQRIYRYPDSCSAKQQRVLIHFIKKRNYDMIEQILSTGFNPNFIYIYKSYDNNIYLKKLLENSETSYISLHVTAYQDNKKLEYDINKLILEEWVFHRDYPNRVVNSLTTPLNVAISTKDCDIVKLLLDYNANPNIPNKHTLVNINSPLFAALPELKLAELLLQYNADPNVQLGRWIPDSKKELKLLVDYGYDIKGMHKKESIYLELLDPCWTWAVIADGRERTNEFIKYLRYLFYDLKLGFDFEHWKEIFTEYQKAGPHELFPVETSMSLSTAEGMSLYQLVFDEVGLYFSEFL